MTLRRKLIVYLALVHLFFGIIAALFILDQPKWFFAIEVVFVLSFWLGYRLIHSLFIPLELIGTGADLIEERDFGSRFRKVGQPEMDRLIEVYNEMIDSLREERLRTEEKDRLLDRIIESSPAGILNVDFDGRVTAMNSAAEKFLGIDREKVVGRDLAEIDHPIAEGMREVGPGESTIVAIQGRRRFRCRNATYLDHGFSRNFFLIDELTEELRASEKAAYGKLIRMMSHEVNNSTGAVRSLLESSLPFSAQMPEERSRDFKIALDVAISRLRNLDRFINGFADVVRLPDPTMSNVNVAQLLRDIVTLMKPDLDARRIRVAVHTDDEPIVEMDKNQIEQVLVNVVRNAMEAIDHDGSIDLELRRGENDVATLTVRDSGSGIATEILPQLFTPFTSTKKDGRGIGLTVISEILSQHGFDFSLENHAEGGAVFTIAFR